MLWFFAVNFMLSFLEIIILGFTVVLFGAFFSDFGYNALSMVFVSLSRAVLLFESYWIGVCLSACLNEIIQPNVSNKFTLSAFKIIQLALITSQKPIHKHIDCILIK